ncbi:unnamed protein product [Boreogadus saida]
MPTDRTITCHIFILFLLTSVTVILFCTAPLHNLIVTLADPSLRPWHYYTFPERLSLIKGRLDLCYESIYVRRCILGPQHFHDLALSFKEPLLTGISLLQGVPRLTVVTCRVYLALCVDIFITDIEEFVIIILQSRQLF